jgi:hypothetical protein
MESPAAPPSTGKVVATLVLGGLGLLGLGMTLCGGFFAIASAIELGGGSSGEARMWAEALIVMGGGSLVAGLVVIALVIVAWRRWVRPPRG